MGYNDRYAGETQAKQSPPDTRDIQAALNAGMALGEPHLVGDSGQLAVVLTPAGTQLHRIDLQEFEDKYRDNPRRKTGSRSLATAASFIAYVNAHKLASTAIYADKDATSFRAVFNDHEPESRERRVSTVEDLPDGISAGDAAVVEHAKAVEQESDGKMHLLKVEYDVMGTPGWGDFGATYDCPQSVEWKRWMGNSQHAADSDGKRAMSQEAFMQFLEDNLLDIVKPESAQLLQAVHSFEAKKDVAFKSAQRLQDGSVVFNYTEQVNQVAQDGKLSLPELFTICIPVFDGGAKYELDARLRYRVGGGGLKLWYELVRPHKVLEHAFNTVLDEVTKGTADVPIYSV